MASLFGTDGVRDRAGHGQLSPGSVRAIARAVAAVLAEDAVAPEDPRDAPTSGATREERRSVLIGRDTRASGPELEGLIAQELLAAGLDVVDLGVIPTPGVAWAATHTPECAIAIVISASHNPAEYNGIKLVSRHGAKVSDAFEEAVTAVYAEIVDGRGPTFEDGPRGRRIDRSDELRARYVDFLVSTCQRPERLHGRRVALDCAHGAAAATAPEVFRRLGLTVDVIGAEPDGQNINEGFGALHPEVLARRVVEVGADFGFCFDGDADRVIPVGSAGTVLDGDFVLALAARHYQREGRLPNATVVGTVMSNVGLERCLEETGLRLLRTPVGDRHVYRALLDEGHPFGGEQSGHLIFIDAAHTGDGVLAAIRLLDCLEGDGLDLEREAAIMQRFPQILRNVRVRERVPFESLPTVGDVVRDVEEELGDRGRVLLRYSGTEPLARVMLEGPDQATISALCDRICGVIRHEIGD